MVNSASSHCSPAHHNLNNQQLKQVRSYCIVGTDRQHIIT
ncbi:hypothetical protein BSPWISOX_2264 [uncultured Gammaproteobacteria bacterium]|nr:hypothetical protein BSPWISOX_2264 [uncultured Gammaproteobacteria bacterium]